MKSLMASLEGISATWDVILFLSVSAILFFWGAAKGKNRIKFVILALYIAVALSGVLPFQLIEENITQWSSALIRSSILGLLVLVLIFFLQRIFKTGEGKGAIIKTLLLSLITAGFVMNILLTQISPATTTFSAIVLQLFSPTIISWWWNVIPILGVILL